MSTIDIMNGDRMLQSGQSPVMVFHITIDGSLISGLSTPEGSVKVIPFAGHVESDLFTGEILPGAADVQTTDRTGSVHMCAKYMFRGKDRDGKECHMFVENNGCFTPGQGEDEVIHACPKFITDSEALGDYLSKSSFRTEVHPTKSGVDVLVYTGAES